MLAFGDRFIALVFAIGVLVSGVLAVLTTGAQAGPYEDALSRFSADSFDQTIATVIDLVMDKATSQAAEQVQAEDERTAVPMAINSATQAATETARETAREREGRSA